MWKLPAWAVRPCSSCSVPVVSAFLCTLVLAGFHFLLNDQSITSGWSVTGLLQSAKYIQCKNEYRPTGTRPLPIGIVSRKSSLEMQPIQGSENIQRFTRRRGKTRASNSLLAIAAGIKQKNIVNRIATKFFSNNFTIMLFHYDGAVDEWGDLHWSNNAVHVSAINQTKWWFAKRFLHPDIVSEYHYVFLWDEDLGVENFHPGRYVSIIVKEGLHISQPALDSAKSEVHHPITARGRRGQVHRRIYKSKGSFRCYANSSAPPCTGWVETMAPVFSRAAWRCVWHMIQVLNGCGGNDMIHAWGLDKKLGYCAQGDRSKNIGVVDSEYIVHMGIPTLGAAQNKTPPESSDYSDRKSIRQRSYMELVLFEERWKQTAAADVCWRDPYS